MIELGRQGSLTVYATDDPDLVLVVDVERDRRKTVHPWSLLKAGWVLKEPPAMAAAPALTAGPIEGWNPAVDQSHPLIVLDKRHKGSFDALVAPGGACILNGAEGRGKCVQPPLDGDGYRYAHTSGNKAVIPMGLPHADVRLPMGAAVQHYADTGYAAAVVTYSEDEAGNIWATGDLVPGISARDRVIIAHAALSGDWRWVEEEGRYRMIASQIVNTPGFRTAAKRLTSRQFAMAAAPGALITSWDTDADWFTMIARAISDRARKPRATVAAIAAHASGRTHRVAAMTATVAEAIIGYAPGQARVPAGSSGGGQFAGRGGIVHAIGVSQGRKSLTAEQVAVLSAPPSTAGAYLESDGAGGMRFTMERHLLHERIIAEGLASGQASTDPSFTMLGGGAASGKSSVLKPTGVKVDPDEIKAKLPEYAPKAPELTHEESSYLAKELTTRALDKRYDVTIDGVGGNLASVSEKVAQARAKGYKHVKGVYVTTSIEEAMGRNAERARSVPPHRLIGGHVEVSGNFQQLAGLFDEVTLTENPQHKPLVPIAKTVNGTLVIEDQAAWQRFLAKAATTPAG